MWVLILFIWKMSPPENRGAAIGQSVGSRSVYRNRLRDRRRGCIQLEDCGGVLREVQGLVCNCCAFSKLCCRIGLYQHHLAELVVESYR